MISVLYAGAANLAHPSSGMDLGSRCHFEELADDPELAMTAISVSPSVTAATGPARRPVRLLGTDISAKTAAGKRLVSKVALLARGGILFQTGFMSRAARTILGVQLAQAPEVLIVDHIAALANISLLQLALTRLRGRTKILVVSHDISSELVRDRARTASSKLKSLVIHLHAMHCHLYEIVVFALANRVFFVSTDDRDRFSPLSRAKTDAMCQIIELPSAVSDVRSEAQSGEVFGRYLVFVGSPSFFPNAMAIDWINQRFAPELLARHPDLKILLVGKGTDNPETARPANVDGLGFVDDERLHRLLRGSCGALSPVVHGAGIKIKVLEAIAAGCAIFATAESLRGYDFMRLDPLLDVNDPAASADRVGTLVADPARLAAYRDEIAVRWSDYKLARHGRLADIVKRLGSAEVTHLARPQDQPVAP